jgi:hypothetical protein
MGSRWEYDKRPPFGVIAEYPTSYIPYIVTAAGVLLQFVDRFSWLYITDDGLHQRPMQLLLVASLKFTTLTAWREFVVNVSAEDRQEMCKERNSATALIPTTRSNNEL